MRLEIVEFIFEFIKVASWAVLFGVIMFFVPITLQIVWNFIIEIFRGK